MQKRLCAVLRDLHHLFLYYPVDSEESQLEKKGRTFPVRSQTIEALQQFQVVHILWKNLHLEESRVLHGFLRVGAADQ